MQKQAVLMALQWLVVPFLRKVVARTDNTVDDRMLDWADKVIQAVMTVK